MHKIQTMLILALLMVPTVSRAQYDTYIWKADSLFMFGEFAQSSAMFDKAFQTGQPVEGRHLYNAACVAALAGDKDVAFKRLFARMKIDPNWYTDGIGDDKDLFSLHDDARWKTFLDSLSVRQERVERHYDKLGTAGGVSQEYGCQHACLGRGAAHPAGIIAAGRQLHAAVQHLRGAEVLSAGF